MGDVVQSGGRRSRWWLAVLPAVLAGAAVLMHSRPGGAAEPAHGDIGANLDGNIDWSTAHIWADAARCFRGWGKVNEPWNADPGLMLTPDGYPLGDADCLSYLNNYPNGTYTLTYSGAGEMTAGGIGRLQNLKRDGKQVTAEVVVRHDNPDETGGMLYLGVRHNLLSDPVRDIRLWAPGRKPGDLFNEDFVRRVRPFTCVRYMDWAGTNNNPTAHWADRTQPGQMMQTMKGIDWETIIALANLVKRDAWVNVPAEADDDYVKHLAELLHGSLDPSLTLRVEYSNEVWNAGFKQFQTNLLRARNNPDVTSGDDFGKAAQQYALRAKAVGDIFRAAYGPDAARLRLVYGAQNSNTYWADAGLGLLKQKFGEPSKYFQDIAIAPYVGNDLPPAAPPGGWTLDNVFPELERFTTTQLAGWVRDAKRSADAFGMKLIAYEGGQHVAGNATLPESLRKAAQDDPRMSTLYHTLLTVWRANGGGLFQAFSHIGTGGWALLEDPKLGGSRKWDAVMDLLLPKGDATLDGKVGYEDFAVLRDHFGKPGKWWWEQGDFNGDNVVDRADFDLLYASLKDHMQEIRPSLREEIEAFRKAHP